jgi:hypothetical protein
MERGERFGRARRQRPEHPRGLRPWLAAAVFFLLLPYAVSFGGGGGATFTLANRTPYYLHAVINNEPVAYIPPGGGITRETSTPYTVIATVTYSPGQGKDGSAMRIFQTEMHTRTIGSGSYDQANDCSGSSSGNTCSSITSSTGQAETVTTIDPITWIVTPDTLDFH